MGRFDSQEVAVRSPLSVLLVDDDAEMRRLLAEALRGEGHRVQTAGDVPGATEALTQTVFDVVVSDVRLPGGDGFDILRRLREESPATEVVLMTAFGTIEDAVAAMKERAFDYITKPFDTQEFLLRVGKAGERRRLREELLDARTQLASMADKPLLVGQSPVLLRLQDQATRVASTDVSVLVIGESGTGKELVARLIHEQSSRAGKAFVAVNCGAVPMSLIEAELFGHEKGAFTGAIKRREGRFVAANHGTLFLDEIGELPLDAQVKLLRVLQEGECTPVGADNPVKVDARIVCATNRDLRELVAEGKFREDLYYRIKVIELRVPPLRERTGDVALLIEHFLRRLRHAGLRVTGVAPAVVAALQQHPFPGNVRELEHAIMHAAVLAHGQELDVEHLPREIRGESDDKRSSNSPLRSLAAAIGEFEREYLRRAISHTEGRRQQAADLLGISRKSLWQKLRKHGLGDASGDGGADSE